MSSQTRKGSVFIRVMSIGMIASYFYDNPHTFTAWSSAIGNPLQFSPSRANSAIRFLLTSADDPIGNLWSLAQFVHMSWAIAPVPMIYHETIPPVRKSGPGKASISSCLIHLVFNQETWGINGFAFSWGGILVAPSTNPPAVDSPGNRRRVQGSFSSWE